MTIPTRERQGYTYAEAAARLGIAEQSLKNLVGRGVPGFVPYRLPGLRKNLLPIDAVETYYRERALTGIVVRRDGEALHRLGLDAQPTRPESPVPTAPPTPPASSTPPAYPQATGQPVSYGEFAALLTDMGARVASSLSEKLGNVLLEGWRLQAVSESAEVAQESSRRERIIQELREELPGEIQRLIGEATPELHALAMSKTEEEATRHARQAISGAAISAGLAGTADSDKSAEKP